LLLAVIVVSLIAVEEIEMKNDQEMTPASKDSANIVDLGSFRRRKVLEQELARGRNPLFVSHLNGKIDDGLNKNAKSDAESPDFGDRLQRIKTSLSKINQLMSELKKISQDQKNNIH
jgi:hypothetical protein